MVFNPFDATHFLNNFWQKRPLVIRGAFSDPYWLEPDDLAGLACELDVESRIIQRVNSKWTVDHGPFKEKVFSTLPEQNWTLLVQGVDQYVPEVKAILNHFGFLPHWRLDDIMVSYAPVGGTVSPHYDFFDVFLIQGSGCRKWQVGDICSANSELLPDTPVRILKEFSPKLEVELKPGDMLYIPARHAHYGVSLENSLTYSVGFRAPSIRDIVDGIANQVIATVQEDSRYKDCDISLAAPVGEIPKAAIKQIKEMLTTAILDERTIANWFGQSVTERKYPDLALIPGSTENWQYRLLNGELMYKNPASRFAYTYVEDACKLYVDGDCYKASLELAQILCNGVEIEKDELLHLISCETNLALVETLLRQGSLICETDLVNES